MYQGKEKNERVCREGKKERERPPPLFQRVVLLRFKNTEQGARLDRHVVFS